MNLFDDLKLNERPPSKCKGIVWRLKVNRFINKKGEVVYTERMTRLKRESCPGCIECAWVLEGIQEFIDMGTPIQIDKIEHNGKYSLKVINITTDWESGVMDGWDLKFSLMED